MFPWVVILLLGNGLLLFSIKRHSECIVRNAIAKRLSILDTLLMVANRLHRASAMLEYEYIQNEKLWGEKEKSVIHDLQTQIVQCISIIKSEVSRNRKD